MFKILFICTDNVGRSVTAKYLLEDWLVKNGRDDVEVYCAGTHAGSDVSSFSMDHVGKLKEMGIDISSHQRMQLTQEVLDACDLAIVMDEEQQEWARGNLGVELPLYNEIYKNEKSSVLITMPGTTETMAQRLFRMVDYIAESMPELVKAIDDIKMRCFADKKEDL